MTTVLDTSTTINLSVTDWVDAQGNAATLDPTAGTWTSDDNGTIVSGITADPSGDPTLASATLVQPVVLGTVNFTFTGTDADGTSASASVSVDVVGADAVSGTGVATAS